ncbi:MAG: hypothetical protein MK186_11965 [Henriciella sp.]|nr:hypothetical protein [Henriciella sp.]
MVLLEGISAENSKRVFESVGQALNDPEVVITGGFETVDDFAWFDATYHVFERVPVFIDRRTAFTVAVSFPQRKETSFAISWKDGRLEFGLPICDLNGKLIAREVELRPALASSCIWAHFLRIAPSLTQQTVDVFWIDNEEEEEFLYSGPITRLSDVPL